MADLFNSAPGPLDMGKMVVSSGKGRDWMEQLPRILRPYGDVAKEYFSEERVRAPLVWMAAQSGPPPSDPLVKPEDLPSTSLLQPIQIEEDDDLKPADVKPRLDVKYS